MADRDDFKHESLQDTESVARYLQALIEGFEKGRLEFTSDDQTLALEPQGLLDLEFPGIDADTGIDLQVFKKDIGGRH